MSGRHLVPPSGVFGLAFAMVLLALQPGQAQNLPPYSVLNPGTGTTTLPGMTTAQAAMARSIDNVCPTISAQQPGSDLANVCGAMIGTALAALGQANPGGLPSIGLSVAATENALQQLNGGAVTLVPTNQVSQLRTVQTQILAARLTVLRTRMLGEQDTPDSVVRLAANDTGAVQDLPGRIQLAQAAPTEASIWSGKLGLFGNLIGQFGSRDPTSTQNGFSFNNEGFLMGGDYRFTPDFAAGAAFGYNYSSTDFDTNPNSAPGQYLHSNLFQINLYSTWQATDALYLDALASFGFGTNDAKRHILIPGLPGGGDRTATGSFDGQTVAAAFGGGYNIPFGALTVTPTARLEYRYVHSDSFTESGAAGLDLTYGASSQSAILSFLGGQAAYAISMDWGVLSPTVRANWAHQYNSGHSSIYVAYANDPSLTSAFVMSGDASDRNYYQLGVGLAVQLSGGRSAFINYDAIVGLNKTSYNSFTAGVRFDF
jgi:outer membrane autotransporter protein